MPPDHADGAGSRATDPDRRALAEFAVSHGEAVPAAGNRPVRFDDPESLWFVERGALDVFLIWVRDGLAEAPFRHVLRLEAGRLAFGCSSSPRECRTQSCAEYRLNASLQEPRPALTGYTGFLPRTPTTG